MKKIILIITLLLFAFPVFADNIAEKVENLINETDPNISIGFRIRNLDKNIIIHEKNVNRYFTFASGLKFITLTTLLEELGRDYKFDSSISRIGNDYYLDIHDPEFTTDDLDILISSLESQNITSIKDNFYIVNKEFLLPPLIRTKTVSDTVYCNTGPITLFLSWPGWYDDFFVVGKKS
jgi:D-alanyl-D-alanine carboxypeptidase